jgi:hypothetical protein
MEVGLVEGAFDGDLVGLVVGLVEGDFVGTKVGALDTEQAIEYIRLALECRETLFGRNHTSTVSTSLRFARLLKSLQDFDQSLLVFKRVLQATEIRFGVLHHTTDH